MRQLGYTTLNTGLANETRCSANAHDFKDSPQVGAGGGQLPPAGFARVDRSRAPAVRIREAGKPTGQFAPTGDKMSAGSRMETSAMRWQMILFVAGLAIGFSIVAVLGWLGII